MERTISINFSVRAKYKAWNCHGRPTRGWATDIEDWTSGHTMRKKDGVALQ